MKRLLVVSLLLGCASSPIRPITGPAPLAGLPTTVKRRVDPELARLAPQMIVALRRCADILELELRTEEELSLEPSLSERYCSLVVTEREYHWPSGGAPARASR